jgi:hypothetical protein
MGAKRKAQTSPVKVSPVGKKARVSETPESIALSKLIAAFDGEVGIMLPPSVVEMVKSVADKCLSSTVENRDELEKKFASLVGQSLESAMEGLTKAHKDAADAVAAEEEKVKALDESLASANELKEKADKALEDAQAAQMLASDKKSEKETELETHVWEENGLQPKKDLMVQDLAALKEVKDTVRGPSNANKKDVQKLQKALKEVEAPSALIVGIGEAIGKQTALDQHLVAEAAKMLYDKSSQIEGELAKFNETVAEYAKKTVNLRGEEEQLTGELNERETELLAAKKKQKDCIAAIKEAEKLKKAGDKSLEKSVQFKIDKEAAECVGTDTGEQYKFLLERTGAVVDAPETVEAEA